MTAGNEQQQIRKRQAVGQTCRQCMAFQVVDGIKRLLCRHGQCLGGHQPDDQSADQPRSCRGGHRIDVGKLHVGIFERARNQPV